VVYEGEEWDTLLRWNNDPEVLYDPERDDVTRWALADVQAMCRGVVRVLFGLRVLCHPR